jgi:hypothetical protein
MAVAREVAPAEVVGEEEDEIRRGGAGAGDDGEQRKEKGSEFVHGASFVKFTFLPPPTSS